VPINRKNEPYTQGERAPKTRLVGKSPINRDLLKSPVNMALLKESKSRARFLYRVAKTHRIL